MTEIHTPPVDQVPKKRAGSNPAPGIILPRHSYDKNRRGMAYTRSDLQQPHQAPIPEPARRCPV